MIIHSFGFLWWITVGSENANLRKQLYISLETFIEPRNESRSVKSLPHSINLVFTVTSISFNCSFIFLGSSRYSLLLWPLLMRVLSLGNLGKWYLHDWFFFLHLDLRHLCVWHLTTKSWSSVLLQNLIDRCS